VSTAAEIHGHCDPRFERLREAFAHNFVAHGELGAACAVYVDGVAVVDLWGGWADKARTRPWTRDTLCGFYSVGKAFTALCELHLCGTTGVELDHPVARYWPEFAAQSKGEITLRQLLTHRAGLPAVRARLPEGAMLDWQVMTAALAAERPWWPPGTAHGYHTNTFGFLNGEVVRRVSGLSLGRYLRRHVTEPLGADLAIGLTHDELPRVAELDWPLAEQAGPVIDLDAEMTEQQRMRAHAYCNPSGLSSLGVLNTEAWRRAEVPSTNGHGTARGIARVYATLARGGELAGVRIADAGLLREARSVQAAGFDLVLERDMRWGLGFQLTHENRPLGPNPDGFGHFGNGGSLGFADPTARLGFGYVMNRIVRNWRSPQNQALVDAVYASL
jgi:CubicO group peptidase (beta-lactamase class C family)